MNFTDVLKRYMNELNCSARELAEASGLSASVISRYKNGERVPAPNSAQLKKLISGFEKVANDNNFKDWSTSSLEKTFNEILNVKNSVNESISSQLNTLIDKLEISQAELARGISYDASRLSRIRSGQRHPSDPKEFINSVSQFVAIHDNSEEYRQKLSELTGATAEEFEDVKTAINHIRNWFDEQSLDISSKLSEVKKTSTKKTPIKNTPAEKNTTTNSVKKAAVQNSSVQPSTIDISSIPLATEIEEFLHQLDTFSLPNYLKELETPQINPFFFLGASLHAFHKSYDTEHILNALPDLLSDCIISKDKGPLIISDEMLPILSKADEGYYNKLMSLLFRALANGTTTEILYPACNDEESYRSLLQEATHHIPLYMTGQVTASCRQTSTLSDTTSLLCGTDEVILTGEMNRKDGEANAYLSHLDDDIISNCEKLESLRNENTNFISIYRLSQRKAFERLTSKNSEKKGTRTIFANTLPICTLPDELLSNILDRNEISKDHQDLIRAYVKKEKAYYDKILNKNKIKLYVPENATALALNGLFYPSLILYHPAEYQKHLESTKLFASEHKNLQLHLCKNPLYQNIQLGFIDKKHLIISKDALPVVHISLEDTSLIQQFYQYLTSMIETK